LDKKIGRAQTLADAERSAPAIVHGRLGDGAFEERARDFSVVKAIRSALPRDLGGGDVDAGFEREISNEVARRSGRAFQGIAVPDQVFLQPQENRTLLAGSSAADLVPNTHRADLFIDRLRSSLATERLGATVLDGLVGTVDIPRQTGSSAAQWVAEDGSLTETDASFDDVTLAPKTVGAMTSYSRRTLLNASPSIEQIVRNDLAAIIARAIDNKAMTGDGTGNTPVGITHTSGVTEITTGGATSWEKILGFIADVEAANALQGSLGWALNAYAVKKLRSTPKVSGTDSVMLMEAPGQLAGYVAAVTSALAGDPSGTPVPGTAIFGDWSSLLIGYWSGVDILLNPYETTAYAKGRVLVRAMRDVDVAVRHPESFAFADDITV
ncbi:phage major capsid protein, partial [Rhizobium sp. LjRoot30]|uniref:phage major capsid protein n=1 Tax=Rhizobium sp. LjRoot30 TaxID=3342320 RepID=UPI003F507110